MNDILDSDMLWAMDTCELEGFLVRRTRQAADLPKNYSIASINLDDHGGEVRPLKAIFNPSSHVLRPPFASWPMGTRTPILKLETWASSSWAFS